MKNNLRNKIASALVGASALIPSLALADDSVTESRPKSALEEAVSALTPTSITTRGYADGHGSYQSQEILSFDSGKFVHRNETGSNVYGLDLNLGKFGSDLEGFRLNAGYQSFVNAHDSDNSRFLVEKSYKKDSALDFWNLELQDNASPMNDRVAGAVGFNLSNKVKVQATADSDNNFGYALIYNASDNGGIGIGGKRVNDLNVFNTAFSYRWSDADSFLNGYKVLGQAKVFDTSTSNSADGFEARVRFGKKTPAGPKLVSVEDTYFNVISPFMGGDGDATFPFGIGDGSQRFDFFGAASSNDGKLGSFSFDFKYHDEPTSKYLKTDVALGLGSVSSSFLKDNVVQVGKYFDLNDSKNDYSNIDLRSSLFSNPKSGWSFDLGARLVMPDEGENQTSAFLDLTYKF